MTYSITKVMVIGLDGVSFRLLQDYITEGYLPECKKILENRFKLHQMDASIPEVSSTSWTSFMTGVNPGEHGIFGFTDLRSNTYKTFFPNSTDVHTPTVWDILGKTVNGRSSSLSDKYQTKLPKPLRSIVLNIPQTYPALPFNGVLTAGFVCPDLRKGTYPDTAYNYLQSIGYLSDVDASKAIDQHDAFFKEVFLALEKRVIAYEHLLNNEPWDLFIGVITETDRMHHFFFDAARDPRHPYHNVFISFYKEIDRVIGRLFTRFMEMTNGKGIFMTMSDHGFTVIKQEVYINAWLAQEGLLKINNHEEYFEQIDTGTKAFAMDPARIYVNMEGKYPRGSVKASEKKQFISELRSALTSLIDNDGNPIIKAVYENDVLYHGPLCEKGPDLVCLAQDGYDLKGRLKRQEVFGKGHFTGMHTRYDAHCILPDSVETPERLHIENLAGIILDTLVNP